MQSPEHSTDRHILRQLFTQGDAFASGPRMAEELGISRAAVWKRIEQLQTLGYDIEAQPHLGYRLKSAGDRVIADEIAARLPGNAFAERLVVFRETRSTNDLALREAQNGAPEGFSVLAEHQTGGRGRMGRTWESNPGQGLWLSMVFRPAWPVPSAQRLTLLVSVAAVRALEKTAGLHCSIKWPNDIMVEDKKLGGALTETQGDMDRIQYAVAGIGLNVHQSSEEFSPDVRTRATSVRIETGSAPRRADLLVAYFQEITALYAKPWPEVLDLWRDRCLTIGQRLELLRGNETLHGQMIGVDDNGALLLRAGNGTIHSLLSGEITRVLSAAS
jgi:BirA family biotin operon repressor/biotin-[acetyl-CoA-carboxylase] ligase